MNAKPPAGRRSFFSDWDEILYLYDKLLYWLYPLKDSGKSRRFANRLAKVLKKTPSSEGAIKGQECWSLVYEARRDFRKAIVYRQKEIRLIQRLHKITVKNSKVGRIVLEGYGIADWSDRLDLLAILQHDAGDLRAAIRTLKKSRQLCRKHRIPFDGKDLLADYLAEKASYALR